MPFNTRNPIPSGDLRDLDDNARNIDTWANDKTKLSHPDRFGVSRRTWHGIEQEAQLNIQQAIDAKNAAQEAAMMSGFSKYADTLAQLEAGIGTDYADGDVVLVFQDEDRGGIASIYKVESGDAVFKNAFDKTRQDLLSFTGTISADAEWSDVPAHSDPAFDVQAKALANRTEYLRLIEESGGAEKVGFVDPTELRSVQNVGDYLKLVATSGAGVRASTIIGVAVNDPTADNREVLQAAYEKCAELGVPLIIDAEIWVSVAPYTYADGLTRHVGLQVPNNSVLIFSAGGALRQQATAENIYYLVNTYLAENFVIYRPKLYGDKETHIVTTGEWGHCLNLVNAKNFIVFKPECYDAWGDGIYAGVEYWSATNKQLENGSVIDPYIENASRNGISITSGKNVEISSPTVKNVQRAWPKAAIDIEPEYAGITPSVLDGVRITGKIYAEDCYAGLEVLLVKASPVGTVNVSVGDVVTKLVSESLIAYNKVVASGSVQVGNVSAVEGKLSCAAITWDAGGVHLKVGDITGVNMRKGLTTSTGARQSLLVFFNESTTSRDMGNIEIGNVTSRYENGSTSKLYATMATFDGVSGLTNRLINTNIGRIVGGESEFINTGSGFPIERSVNILDTPDKLVTYFESSSNNSYAKRVILRTNSNVLTYTISTRVKKPIEILCHVASGWGDFDIAFPSSVSVISPVAIGENRKLRSNKSGAVMRVHWVDDTTVMIEMSNQADWAGQ